MALKVVRLDVPGKNMYSAVTRGLVLSFFFFLIFKLFFDVDHLY